MSLQEQQSEATTASDPRLGTRLLLAVLFVVFIVERVVGATGDDARLLQLGALPDNASIGHEYWRLVTFGFLHANLWHLLLNLLLLLLAGPVVERRVGSWTTLTVFLASSIASGIGILFKHQMMPTAGVSLGASGGMFGLIAAAIALTHRAPAQRTFVRNALILLLAAAFLYSLLPGVSLVGHLVGTAVGLLLGATMRVRRSTMRSTGAA